MLEENLERTFSANPYEQMGGYIKRMRGIRLAFKVENDKSRRIDRLYIDGAPAEDATRHRVAFITAQGVPARIGSNRHNLELSAIDAVRRRFVRPWTGSEAGTTVELI